MDLNFVVNLAAAWFLTGLIWTVQLVHYPLFGLVGERFRDYEDSHRRRIAWIVGPVMLTELVAAGRLLWNRPAYVSSAAASMSLGLVLIVWLSTALIQAPCHQRLAQGFDARVEARLTRSNWIRTVAWTLRALLLTSVLIGAKH